MHASMAIPYNRKENNTCAHRHATMYECAVYGVKIHLLRTVCAFAGAVHSFSMVVDHRERFMNYEKL